MKLELVVVDAFTDTPFGGNPAAIAVVSAFPDDAAMQLVAREMSLSETAFVCKRSDGDFDLRWFTPAVEVDLCGHATLAAAFVIGTPVDFHTRSGVLSCAKTEEGWITLDFPANAPVRKERPSWMMDPETDWFGEGNHFSLLVLGSAEQVRSFVPDNAMLLRLGTEAVVISAPSDHAAADFVSRVFGPAIGIPEDPVTGSAHCLLAEYWGERLGKNELTGEQASVRGGVVRMSRQGERVVLSGQAVEVARVVLNA